VQEVRNNSGELTDKYRSRLHSGTSFMIRADKAAGLLCLSFGIVFPFVYMANWPSYMMVTHTHH